MEIETAQFGRIGIADSQIYSFPKGIPGFEEHDRFAIIDIEGTPFSYLQSLVQREISLLITDPFLFYKDYEFELPVSVIEELELGTEIQIRNIVTLQGEMQQSTLNLLAPLVFNTASNIARQVILHDSPYTSRHLLWGSSSPEKGAE
ncbi:flagellar assembly factor FliW [Paenibacillus antibioticophila]|uniref:Flagellar assembly factor FliW n=1 Tax=Paenibacillus antibioticophila TaxID=1274374 RepID=A0A919XMY1_9BACL|nr:flagellar assembly protein FliW [Paenibacillus antibioticophila]GIO35206.1 flagellar assembly factor FliW [Paenibacillus antibioticophila]